MNSRTVVAKLGDEACQVVQVAKSSQSAIPPIFSLFSPTRVDTTGGPRNKTNKAKRVNIAFPSPLHAFTPALLSFHSSPLRRLAVDNESRDFHADAADLYQEAAIRGHLSAMVALGRHLIGLDDLTSVGWFRAAAERGHPTAWTELGHMYARGYGVERSNPHAVMCWQRGATLGDSAARSCLGLSYIQGFGVEKDADRGVAIVKEIADSGDVISMRNLAWVYRTGRGVPKDFAAADYWDNRAAQTAQNENSANSASTKSSQPQLHPPTPKSTAQSSHPSESLIPDNKSDQHPPDDSKPEIPEPSSVEPRDLMLDDGNHPDTTHEKNSPAAHVDQGDTEAEVEEAPIESTSSFTPTESFIQGTNIPPKTPTAAPHDGESEAKNNTPSSSTRSAQPGLTYLKLVPISQPEETTYLATETTENSAVDSEHPVIAVVKETSEGPPSCSVSMASIGRKISGHSTHSSHFAPDNRSPMSPRSRQSITQIEMPRKGSFWNNNPGNAIGGLEVVDNALTKIQSSSRRSSLDRNAFPIPHTKVSETYPSDNKKVLEGAKFPVQHVEERDVPQGEKNGDSIKSKSRESEAVEEEIDDETKVKKTPSALDIARSTIKRHSVGNETEVPAEKPTKIVATSSSRQPVQNLIAHIEGKEKAKKEGKPSSPPPPPPPMATRPQPPPDLTPATELDVTSSSSPVDERVITPPPVTIPVSPPTPPAPTTQSAQEITPAASSRAVEPKSNEDLEAGFMAEIKSAVSNYPEFPSDSQSRRPVYEFLDAVQRLRADDKAEGEFLVRHRAWDLVVISLFAQTHDVAIQELALHSFIRLLRFIPDDAKEAAVLRSCRDSLLGAGLGHLKLPPGIDEAAPGSIQSVLFAMKMYPNGMQSCQRDLLRW